MAPNENVNFIDKKVVEDKIIYSVKKQKFNNLEIKLNSFDGMGLISPEAAKKIAHDELGLDYTPSAMNIRAIQVQYTITPLQGLRY